MKLRQRKAAIIDYLQLHGKTFVAEYFALTSITICKDLTQLEEGGEVICTYCDVLLSSKEGDQLIDLKTHINTAKKRQISWRAALLIKDGESLIFDAGRMALQTVLWPAPFNKITAMINSPCIINVLFGLDNDHVILMPVSVYLKNSASFHSTLSEAVFFHFNFDKLFIGTAGGDLIASVTTFNELNAVSQAICRATQKCILLVVKFGRKSPNIVCALTAVDILITDKGVASPATLQALRDSGIEVVLVDNKDE